MTDRKRRRDGTPFTKPTLGARVRRRRGGRIHRGNQAGRVIKRNRT